MNRINKTIVFVAAFSFWLFTGSLVYAQQDPMFSKYLYKNNMMYNPAATGRTGKNHASLAYRKQWIGLQGAPSTFAAGFERALDGNKAAIGVNMFHDQIGFDQNASLQFNYAYRIKTSENSRLALGIKGGFNLIFSDFNNAITPDQSSGDDPLHVNQNVLVPRAGFGAMWYTERYFIAASIPSVIAVVPDDGFRLTDDQSFLSKHFYFSTGYVFPLADNDIQIKPFIFLKYHPAAPVQLDYSLQFWYKDIFSTGVSYRSQDALSFMVEIPITQELNLGYAYDYTTSPFRTIGNGAHEIILEFTWANKNIKVPSIHKITNLPKF